MHAARRRLVALVADLESERTAIDESTAASPDDEHDAEGSTVGYERARVDGLLARATRQLADLDRALERIGDGTYRRCVRCAGVISDERLDVLPGTVLCVACAAAGLTKIG